MSKQATDEQIERSLRKLARALAEWNYPRKHRNDAYLTSLLFTAAWKLIGKTGHRADYEERIKVLRRVLE